MQVCSRRLHLFVNCEQKIRERSKKTLLFMFSGNSFYEIDVIIIITTITNWIVCVLRTGLKNHVRKMIGQSIIQVHVDSVIPKIPSTYIYTQNSCLSLNCEWKCHNRSNKVEFIAIVQSCQCSTRPFGTQQSRQWIENWFQLKTWTGLNQFNLWNNVNSFISIAKLYRYRKVIISRLKCSGCMSV